MLDAADPRNEYGEWIDLDVSGEVMARVFIWTRPDATHQEKLMVARAKLELALMQEEIP